MHSYDYAIVRVVPRVERGEFINAGVLLSCAACRFLAARIALDEAALRAIAPGVDLQPIREALQALEGGCAGGHPALARMSARERFHWLVAPRSTSIQMSPVHSGRCGDPRSELERLVRKMVQRPTADGG